MSDEAYEKRQQFLWIVQTSLIGNAINRAKQDADAAYFGSLAMFNFAQDAVTASHLVPDQMTAIDAARDFINLFVWKDEARPEARWITPGFKGWDRKLSAKEPH